MTVTLEQPHIQTPTTATLEKDSDTSYIYLIRFRRCVVCTNPDVEGEPTPEDCQNCLKKPLHFCNYDTEIKHLDREKYTIQERNEENVAQTTLEEETITCETPTNEIGSQENWIIEQLRAGSHLVAHALKGHFGKDFKAKIETALDNLKNKNLIRKEDDGTYQLTVDFEEKSTEIPVASDSEENHIDQQDTSTTHGSDICIYEKWILQQLLEHQSLDPAHNKFSQEIVDQYINPALSGLVDRGLITQDYISKEYTLTDQGIAELSFVTADRLVNKQQTLDDPTVFTRLAEEQMSHTEENRPPSEVESHPEETIAPCNLAHLVTYHELDGSRFVTKVKKCKTLEEAITFSKNKNHFSITPII